LERLARPANESKGGRLNVWVAIAIFKEKTRTILKGNSHSTVHEQSAKECLKEEPCCPHYTKKPEVSPDQEPRPGGAHSSSGEGEVKE